MKDDMQFDCDLMRMKRLQAAEAHDAAPTEMGVEIGSVRESFDCKWIPMECGGIEAEIVLWDAYLPNSRPYFRFNVDKEDLCLGDEGMKCMITLLQKAREYMQGGG